MGCTAVWRLEIRLFLPGRDKVRRRSTDAEVNEVVKRFHPCPSCLAHEFTHTPPPPGRVDIRKGVGKGNQERRMRQGGPPLDHDTHADSEKGFAYTRGRRALYAHPHASRPGGHSVPSGHRIDFCGIHHAHARIQSSALPSPHHLPVPRCALGQWLPVWNASDRWAPRALRCGLESV